VGGLLTRLKGRWFPGGFRRTANRYVNHIAHRTTRKTLANSFRQLGIEPGAVICVHSALSRLGHLVEGPESVVLALRDAVPGCTIMMPTFPVGSTALDYVSLKPVYDLVRTPSLSGLLTEAFRKMPNVRRSFHPTHPCAALGPKADELIDGSELSVTPFGGSSTYGRFSERDDAVLLLIHTNNTSMVHRFQEIVDMPNLFFPQLFEVEGKDQAGARRTYSLNVHNPVLPLYVALAASGSGEAQYIWFPDYVVQFPRLHAERIHARLTAAEAKQFLKTRQAQFFETKVFRQASHSKAELLAIRVRPWQDRICQDLRRSIAIFEEFYKQEILQAAHKNGQLTH
jgi:aminoglycoside N3'-acetyltransferase